jgi:hypothetical protein
MKIYLDIFLSIQICIYNLLKFQNSPKCLFRSVGPRTSYRLSPYAGITTLRSFGLANLETWRAPRYSRRIDCGPILHAQHVVHRKSDVVATSPALTASIKDVAAHVPHSSPFQASATAP